MTNIVDLQQYMTPAWAAQRLVELHYAHLGMWDTVCEPTCGTGAFLAAIPAHVPAFGVEIDASLGEIARQRSGRDVLIGDFCEVEFNAQPTHFIGNPPFSVRAFDRILHRCHALLPSDGEAAFILPAYLFQTASRVVDYHRQWGIEASLIPRNIFDGIEKPLVWAVFRKGVRHLVGLALYHDTDGVRSLKAKYQKLLHEAAGSAWRTAVIEALLALGGEASLDQLYEEIGSRRPSENGHWRAQIRKIVQRDCVRIDRARYSLPAAAAA